MEPGDLLLWTLFTVHGSAPNVSDYDRRFMINSYVRAGDSDRGEWAFRGGVSTPLGTEPEICKYEQLRERPGPFYVEADWTEEAAGGAQRLVDTGSGQEIVQGSPAEECKRQRQVRGAWRARAPCGMPLRPRVAHPPAPRRRGNGG